MSSTKQMAVLALVLVAVTHAGAFRASAAHSGRSLLQTVANALTCPTYPCNAAVPRHPYNLLTLNNGQSPDFTRCTCGGSGACPADKCYCPYNLALCCPMGQTACKIDVGSYNAGQCYVIPGPSNCLLPLGIRALKQDASTRRVQFYTDVSCTNAYNSPFAAIVTKAGAAASGGGTCLDTNYAKKDLSHVSVCYHSPPVQQPPCACDVTKTDATATCNVTKTDATATCDVTKTDATATCNVTKTDATATCDVYKTDAKCTCSCEDKKARCEYGYVAMCIKVGQPPQVSATPKTNLTQGKCEAEPKVYQGKCEAEPKVYQGKCEAEPKVYQGKCEAEPKVYQGKCEPKKGPYCP